MSDQTLTASSNQLLTPLRTVEEVTTAAFEGGLITAEYEDEFEQARPGTVYTAIAVDLGEVAQSLADAHGMTIKELNYSLGIWLTESMDSVSDILYGWVRSLSED